MRACRRWRNGSGWSRRDSDNPADPTTPSKSDVVSLLSNQIEHLQLGEIAVVAPDSCPQALKQFPADSFDLVFCCPHFDPSDRIGPFRLESREQVDRWSECVTEASRLISKSGGMFIYGLPAWLPFLGIAAGESLSFRNWIAVRVWDDPVERSPLVPSQAGLLFYVKDQKRSTINRVRLPHPTCTACDNLLSDWGGHKDKCNPAGVTMSDVWLQIPSEATIIPNLPDGALIRALTLATQPGDSVLLLSDIIEAEE